METWDSALFARAIRSAAVHLDPDNSFFYQCHITSGMFLSRLSLTHIDDIQEIVVSQEDLLQHNSL